jgi:hypothetical protein
MASGDSELVMIIHNDAQLSSSATTRMTRYFSGLSMLTFCTRPFLPPIFFIPPFVLTLRAPSSSRFPFSHPGHPFISSPSSSFQSTFIFSHLFSPPIFFISNYLPVTPSFPLLEHLHLLAFSGFIWTGPACTWLQGVHSIFSMERQGNAMGQWGFFRPRHFPPSGLFCEM